MILETSCRLKTTGILVFFFAWTTFANFSIGSFFTNL